MPLSRKKAQAPKSSKKGPVVTGATLRWTFFHNPQQQPPCLGMDPGLPDLMRSPLVCMHLLNRLPFVGWVPSHARMHRAIYTP